MIDAENEIFSRVSTNVRNAFKDSLFMTGEYVPSPNSFPCVSIIETDNRVLDKTRTNTGTENHVAVTYEVNVYSNLKKGKKSQCKEIMALIDNEFEHLGFTRSYQGAVPNELDATIYRLVARYGAVISKEHIIFRR